MKIVTDCAARTCCVTTKLRLFYITGRNGCITFRIHGKSTFDVPRIMAVPHVRCLVGSGLIHYASVCHVASQELRTLPVLSKTAELPLVAPQLFLPDRIPLVESHELAPIEAALSPKTSGLDFIKERLVTPRQAFDVDTLLHVHHKSVHAAQVSHWLRLITIVACSVTIMVLLLFPLQSYFRIQLLRCWPGKTDPTPMATPPSTNVPDAMLEHREAGTRSQDTQGRLIHNLRIENRLTLTQL